MKQRVADIVASFLVDQGVKDIFTLTGGGAMFLNDGIASNDDINAICNHHEQACAMGAVAYAKYKNGLAAAMFSTGCGSTNAITGLLDAWQDSAPVIFISGQIKRKETSRNSQTSLRQFGVQEADIVSIVESLTKYAVMVNEPEDILYHLEKAAHLALTGRPGPVWIDIPLDVQGFSIDTNELKHFIPKIETNQEIKGMEQFIEMYEQAERPIILAGNGVRLSGSVDKLREFASKNNIPCAVSYLATDYFEQDNPNYVGRLGIKGDRAGNFALQNSDLIISLGSRLSVCLTGFEYELFARESKLIVVDIDKDEHKKNTVNIDQLICADVGDFLENIENKITPKASKDWQNKCIHWKNKWPVYQGGYDTDTVNMYEFIKVLSELASEDSIVVSDAGSSYYVTSQSFTLNNKKQRYITSGAQADMGFTLPAAIGACIAANKPVIGITGDGSFQLNIQELQTIKHYNLPVKLIVWNNNGYLSIRATQNKFFDGRRIGTDPESGVSFPEVEKIASAYELPYVKINNVAELREKLADVIATSGPVICEVMCPENQEIIPAVSAVKNDDGSMTSKPIEDMYPFLDRGEFFSDMIVSPLIED
jgi:acetolactate synthase I/II/III large subunit